MALCPQGLDRPGQLQGYLWVWATSTGRPSHTVLTLGQLDRVKLIPGELGQIPGYHFVHPRQWIDKYHPFGLAVGQATIGQGLRSFPLVVCFDDECELSVGNTRLRIVRRLDDVCYPFDTGMSEDPLHASVLPNS